MPTIKQAVRANEQRIEQHGDVRLPHMAQPALSPGVQNGRSLFPSRGTLPYNIVQATDFEAATGFTSQRLRARVLLSSTHPLLEND